MVELHYPGIHVAELPRWLGNPANRREGQQSSAVVLTIQGSLTLATLGIRTLYLGNRPCRLDTYYAFSASTQCSRCQRFGHPEPRCPNPKADPTCGICAGKHQTRAHQCPLDVGCPGGARCNHQPLRCVNCPEGERAHRSTDPACPVRTAAEATARQATQDARERLTTQNNTNNTPTTPQPETPETPDHAMGEGRAE
jgi:hypothetical protein